VPVVTSPFWSLVDTGNPVRGLKVWMEVNGATGPAPSGSGEVEVIFWTCPPGPDVYAVVVMLPAASVVVRTRPRLS